jgi:hypothetical protein
MFEPAMRSVKKGKNKQADSQNHLTCACANQIQEREWMFEKQKIMNSKVHDIMMRVIDAEK